jgi:hypothetical protein
MKVVLSEIKFKELAMKLNGKTIAVAISAIVCAAMWSTTSAQAYARLVVHHHAPWYFYQLVGPPLQWDAVRAYYAGGPWGYGYTGWADYAARNGILCTPGTIVKGGDGILYVCQ